MTQKHISLYYSTMISNRVLVGAVVIAIAITIGVFALSEYLTRDTLTSQQAAVMTYQGKELILGTNPYPEINRFILTGNVEKVTEQNENTIKFALVTGEKSTPFTSNEKSIIIELGKTLILEQKTEDQDLHQWRADYSATQIMDLLVAGVPASVIVPSEKEANTREIAATHIVIHSYTPD